MAVKTLYNIGAWTGAWTQIRDAFTTAGWTVDNIYTSGSNYQNFDVTSSQTIDGQPIKYYIKLASSGSSSYYCECKSYDTNGTTILAQRTNIIRGSSTYLTNYSAVIGPDYFFITGTSANYCGRFGGGNIVEWDETFGRTGVDNLVVLAANYTVSTTTTMNPWFAKARTIQADGTTLVNNSGYNHQLATKSFTALTGANGLMLYDFMVYAYSGNVYGGKLKPTLGYKCAYPDGTGLNIAKVNVGGVDKLHINYGLYGSLLLDFVDVA